MSRRRRVVWGAALLWVGLLLAALHLRPIPGATSGGGAMFRLAPGPDGPVIFHNNNFQHEAYPRNVAAVLADASIGSPLWTLGDRPLVLESRLDLEVWPHASVEWPWPEQTAEEVVDPLRERIAGMMRIGSPQVAPLKPGWWDTPQRTILWREIGLTAVSWLALPLLAIGLYLVARRSKAERAFAKLRGRGICPSCDYDLTGARDRCPECGRPIAPDEQTVIPT